MSKAQYGLVLVLAILSGLIGGMGAGMIAGPLTSQVFPAKFLRAKRFEVVNKRGRILASLDDTGLTFFAEEGAHVPAALNAELGRLKLHDQAANRVIELDANSLSLALYDSSGKLVWKIPPEQTHSQSPPSSPIPQEAQP
jgi:hypothetical protein